MGDSAATPSPEPAPYVFGGFVGGVAYVVGFVATYVLVALDRAEYYAPQWSGGDLQIYGWEFVGWVFYGAHFVPVEFRAPGAEAGSVNVLEAAGLSQPAWLFHLVPVVALVGAGYVVVSAGSVSRLPSLDAATWGATVAIGYLPLVALGTRSFAIDRVGFVELSMAPALGSALVTCGVLAVALGAFGGYVANRR